MCLSTCLPMARSSSTKTRASFNTTFLQSLALTGIVETGEALSGDHHGSACKAVWKGTTCTIKKLYLAPTANNLSSTVERFEQECKLLCRVRHPNIVQFLGLVVSGEPAIPPALVWEHCPLSLTELLEAAAALPIHLQVSIVKDVSQALAYLHCGLQQQPVIHGSITAASVLLSQALQAKLSGLGVARMVDANKTLSSEAYLPPEVHSSSKPRYSVAVDVFSLGNLMLHIACRAWPVPREGSRAPREHSRVTRTAQVELERRRKYVDEMGEDHLLAKLVRECLHGDPDHRPKTLSIVNQLCEILERVRPQFETLLDLMTRMERRESELLHTAEDLTKEREKLQASHGGKRFTGIFEIQSFLQGHAQSATNGQCTSGKL